VRERALRVVRGLLDREERGLAAALSRPAMAAPYRMVDERAAEVADRVDRARRSLRHALDRADADLVHTLARVVALSPAATLSRGYAVLQREEDGAVVRSAHDVRPGEALRARVAEGGFAVRVSGPDAGAGSGAGGDEG
jgi:exodeoxyribonuclease VII large subunit